MMNVLISGCGGRMGHVVASMLASREDMQAVGGVDLRPCDDCGFSVFSSPEKVNVPVDVVIDFSNPSALLPLLDYAEANKVPVALCTTGYNSSQVEALKKAAKTIPVFYSRNMSLGINLLIELSKKAEKVLGPDFDVEIIEKHHNQKIDAPSGTALMIADAVSQARGEDMHYVYDRHSQRKKREPSEIGIHSIRGGTIVGEHEVMFAGNHEVITISHSAQSKEVFAAGAVNAAAFLAGKAAGLYDMSDLLK
ncbi:MULTISPECIES: 4-hydroxy-tetrahydrodipicolinate reductase [Caproicibacterium]|jgi:4-hydroxy-tetrahydrodipicolinate reductase|uniref:4-hydroxy-tetrahydrodipicolinate reductase n=1 Tax=Caproicibacterium lactatifermentans TaxID=2666138 RepID=A0ABX6PXH7_9FIRM|nr:4-hydroxy-tetrahydrodipicolinate reductase [Caproicibacterium lactatifermentans]ARP50328.1 4-hydroxy-tetrahydrodipicolinate reductase [Ruminococcaceae bacterium CPB6]QKO30979.1 4-hydroxy-tetrahydrodipicolinate reductase [Caproicibacterium lactatifermentans]